jgi:ABC-2 type transport system permease protein
MRKYLNKGLLYEWFTASKIPILIGLISWGFIAHVILTDYISITRTAIGEAEFNSFKVTHLDVYFILGVIFLAIYLFASGISKKNTTMFLCSGPFTKKQIKINELICLMITLGLFIIMYLYIAVTIYVKNNELMSIANGYPEVILIEVIRLLLFGTIGILLMIEMDLLFSNSIIAYFGMIALGAATILILFKSRGVSTYIGHGRYSSVMDEIFGNIIYGNSKRLSILFYGGDFHSNDLGIILKGIIFLVAIIGIMLLIFNVLEKRAKLETVSKIFSCKANENMIVVYLSLGIGAFINLSITDIILDRMVYKNGRIQPFLNSNSMVMLAIDVVSIGIITFISYKIIKKILKVVG